MASEKQIAANRANAKRSTGPRTAKGKKASSRNAYRHGLCRPLPFVPDLKVEAIAQAVLGEQPGEERLLFAAEFAQAHLELLRIRATRADMLTAIKWDNPGAQPLRQLASLDRYERYAHTRRRRASAKL
jgi:hypothetical protein